VEPTRDVLSAEGIRKAFGGAKALADVDFSCRNGEVHALVGANGAGKSTLIKILTGVLPPDAGTIRIDDQIFGPGHRRLTPSAAKSLGIAAVYQEFTLMPDLTMAENIFLARLPRGRFGMVSTRSMNEDAAELLNSLGISLDPRTKVRLLSVAERQIVEVAKALAQKARLVLLDEPSAVLGGRTLEQLFAAVRGLRAHGVSIVYISHRLAEVFEIGERVTVLRDGHVVAAGPVAATNRDELIRAIVGRPVNEQYPRRAAEPGEVIVSVRGLNAVDGRLSNVSLDIRAGEILGIAGFVGSGRSRLLRCLFGVEKVISGAIQVVGGRPPSSAREAVKLRMALTPEDRRLQGLFLQKPLRFNLTIVVLRLLSRLGVISSRRESALCRDLVVRFSIKAPARDQRVDGLSGGNQQKVVLAKWLALHPRVLLMDEPTRGIDVGTKAEIYSLIRDLAEDGVAVVVVSSDTTELLGVSDRIVVMRNGTVVVELPVRQATEELVIEYATAPMVT